MTVKKQTVHQISGLKGTDNDSIQHPVPQSLPFNRSGPRIETLQPGSHGMDTIYNPNLQTSRLLVQISAVSISGKCGEMKFH